MGRQSQGERSLVREAWPVASLCAACSGWKGSVPRGCCQGVWESFQMTPEAVGLSRAWLGGAGQGRGGPRKRSLSLELFLLTLPCDLLSPLSPVRCLFYF